MEGFPSCIPLGVCSLTTEISTGPPNSCSSFSSCAHSDETQLSTLKLPGIVRVSPRFHGDEGSCNGNCFKGCLLHFFHIPRNEWNGWVFLLSLKKSTPQRNETTLFRYWYCSSCFKFFQRRSQKTIETVKKWRFLSNLQVFSSISSTQELVPSIESKAYICWQVSQLPLHAPGDRDHRFWDYVYFFNNLEPQPCQKNGIISYKTGNKFWNGSWAMGKFTTFESYYFGRCRKNNLTLVQVMSCHISIKMTCHQTLGNFYQHQTTFLGGFLHDLKS